MPEQLSFPGFGTAPLPRRPRKPAHRLFFAIFPDADAAARIARLAWKLRGELRLQGKPLPLRRFHVSLLGFGTHTCQPRETVARAREAAAAVAGAPFDVEFDRIASFPRRLGEPLLVLLGSGGVAALTSFEETLEAAITGAGFYPATRLRFTPHVTLLYAERRVGEQAVEPIGWPVREFVLIDSLQGLGRHVPLGRWSLSG
jgi:2'-5' RNA ligase